jgi:hypothetical protein
MYSMYSMCTVLVYGSILSGWRSDTNHLWILFPSLPSQPCLAPCHPFLCCYFPPGLLFDMALSCANRMELAGAAVVRTPNTKYAPSSCPCDGMKRLSWLWPRLSWRSESQPRQLYELPISTPPFFPSACALCSMEKYHLPTSQDCTDLAKSESSVLSPRCSKCKSKFPRDSGSLAPWRPCLLVRWLTGSLCCLCSLYSGPKHQITRHQVMSSALPPIMILAALACECKPG